MAATQAQCESGSFRGGTTALAQMCGEGKNRISRRLRRVRRNLQFARRRSGILQARRRCRFGGVGATLLATTHDPVELQRLKVLGIIADPKEARRARELGAPKGSLPTSC